MTNLRYKGFHIVTRPYQVADSRRWTVDLEIRRAGRKQGFSLNERYPTEQEADARCAGLGQRIIDGKVVGWSVDRRLRQTGLVPAIKQMISGEFGVFGLAMIAIGGFLMLFQASAAYPEPTLSWAGGIIVAAGVLCLLLGARVKP